MESASALWEGTMIAQKLCFMFAPCLVMTPYHCIVKHTAEQHISGWLRCRLETAPVGAAAVYEDGGSLPGLHCACHAHEFAEGRQRLRPLGALGLQACHHTMQLQLQSTHRVAMHFKYTSGAPSPDVQRLFCHMLADILRAYICRVAILTPALSMSIWQEQAVDI